MLTADNPENLLPTIVSRCETVRLHPMPFDQLQAGLQNKRDIPEQITRQYAHLSGGRPGLALRMVDNPPLLEERSGYLSELVSLSASGIVERFARAEALYKDKDRLRIMLTHWLSFWRDVLLKNAGASAPITNLDWDETVAYAADKLPPPAVRQMVASLERSLDLLDRNVNQRLALEIVLLDLPHLRLQSGLEVESASRH
jgi:DNA polymerase-3 subunit delta'